MALHVSELRGDKLEIALTIRTATVEIVRNALEKKLHGFPVSFAYTCSKPVDSYKFCCIPTESFLRDLVKKLENVTFMEAAGTEVEDTFAYVIPANMDDIVYLCPFFWDAPNRLCYDSKPGTLIHEVSHLLGTEDITYDRLTVELWENEHGEGILMGKSKCLIDKEMGLYVEEVSQINANSLEHEYETIINHKQSYQGGKYLCCGETKVNSVCTARSTGHYHLHSIQAFDKHRKQMEKNLQKYKQELLLTNTSNQQMIRYEKLKNSVCKKTCLPLK